MTYPTSMAAWCWALRTRVDRVTECRRGWRGWAVRRGLLGACGRQLGEVDAEIEGGLLEGDFVQALTAGALPLANFPARAALRCVAASSALTPSFAYPRQHFVRLLVHPRCVAPNHLVVSCSFVQTATVCLLPASTETLHVARSFCGSRSQHVAPKSVSCWRRVQNKSS